jgi:hypothetical protein
MSDQENNLLTEKGPYDHILEEEEDSIDIFNYLDDGHGGDHGAGHSSVFASSVQIANTIMGAGILSLPKTIRYLGIIPGAIFITLIALNTIYSVHLLMKCKDITKR